MRAAAKRPRERVMSLMIVVSWGMGAHLPPSQSTTRSYVRRRATEARAAFTTSFDERALALRTSCCTFVSRRSHLRIGDAPQLLAERGSVGPASPRTLGSHPERGASQWPY